MPRYDFECAKGHLTERELPVESGVRVVSCAQCGRNARKIISQVALTIPTYMKAEADDVNRVQSRFLQSERHREMREQNERIQDRDSGMRQDFERFKHSLPEKVR